MHVTTRDAILTTCFVGARNETYKNVYTVWPENLAGNLICRIGGFVSDPPN